MLWCLTSTKDPSDNIQEFGKVTNGNLTIPEIQRALRLKRFAPVKAPITNGE